MYKRQVLGLGTGVSLTPVFNELIRRHKEEGLSFKNVIVFNAYEYFPLNKDSQNSTLNQLKSRLLDHIDIEEKNVFAPDGTISQDEVQQYCRLYEQNIKKQGGIDIMLLGIGDVYKRQYINLPKHTEKVPILAGISR